MPHAPSNLPSFSPFIEHWTLSRGCVFLNHGSFGATPRLVQEAQRAWRDRLEAEPVKFYVEDHQQIMDDVRKALAAFVHCPWDALALLPNATTAVATVFACTPLAPGDEVLITSHEYLACQNSARRLAREQGGVVTVAQLPFPCPGPDAIVDAVLRAVTPRTKIALLSHVTSPTGLVLPMATLVRELEARGVRTLVDGAHAPGMVDVNLSTLGASYYTANCHKWICSPKGSAFLYVRPDLQAQLRPLALSNNAEHPKPARAQFLTEFDYVGTQDCTALYSIADALRVMPGLVSGGWPEIMRRNHALALQGRDIICSKLGVAPPAPDAMLGSIVAMELPRHDADRHARLLARPTKYHDAIQDRILEKWKIQVPIWSVPNSTQRLVRISAQLYNAREQYEYLAEALAAELAAERAM
jgi:isopenicillin-N epimerase